ncbi:M15 family metallopeptidase [uncultured Aquimarina sp.]|uniref:M15 family metallopeptidase n=1 Tax=uncultured Aquimarina sp. TaxID=575652 RepID=UPI00261ECF2F|nr:M15 family metallopeptidase [uncultured Aquimarina sp.]
MMKTRNKILIGVAIVGLIFVLRKPIERAVWDLISQQRINTLHPDIRERAKAFINKAEREGIKLRVTDATRTFDEQDALYAQGRTTPGDIVTDARAGFSYHNYGLAIDVVEMVNGQPIYNNPNWQRIGEIGESFGFSWGASFNDKPHFHMTFGNSIADLQRKLTNEMVQEGFVIV